MYLEIYVLPLLSCVWSNARSTTEIKLWDSFSFPLAREAHPLFSPTLWVLAGRGPSCLFHWKCAHCSWDTVQDSKAPTSSSAISCPEEAEERFSIFCLQFYYVCKVTKGWIRLRIQSDAVCSLKTLSGHITTRFLNLVKRGNKSRWFLLTNVACSSVKRPCKTN